MIGTFVPFLGVPLLHDKTYWQLSTTGALILIALAVFSIVAAGFKKFGWLYLTGLGSLGLLLYSIQKVGTRKADVLSDLAQSLEGSPLRGLGLGFVNAVDYRYGWAIMLLGAIVLIAVPLLGNRIGFRKRAA
jgi:hypothetical protein